MTMAMDAIERMGLAVLKRPVKTAPAVFFERDVFPDMVFVSKDATRHEAHKVAIASRVDCFQGHLKTPTKITDKKQKLKVNTSGHSIEVFLRWVYKGDLSGIDIDSALNALQLAEICEAAEFSYDIHDWVDGHLGSLGPKELFILLASTFYFVQFSLGVKYMTLLLKNRADFASAEGEVEGMAEDVGIWGIRMLAAAMSPAGHSAKGKSAQTVPRFKITSYADLKLKSTDGTIHPTTRAFWAQCEEVRLPLRDPTVTTLKVDGDAQTIAFLVKLINGEEIRDFGVDIFRKVYLMAHQYDLFKVMECLDAMALEIFSLNTQVGLVAWSAMVPRGMLGPRLASWLWKDLRFDALRDNPPRDVSTTGGMGVKLGLTLRSLPYGRWHDYSARAYKGLTFLHVEDHHLVWFV